MWINYEETPDGAIAVVRLYGDDPEVELPEEIDGKPVTVLMPYAFSEKAVAPGAGLAGDAVSGALTFDGLSSELSAGTICELAGDFISSVKLPDSMKQIGELCFYQCRNLREICFGGGEIEIGSDAFMNCRSLSTIRIRARAEEPTSLRQILAGRSQATVVWFEDAAVFFPEYQERYDLIGPAHIFELNIEGEGFRARKCFNGDRFDLTLYDEVFKKAVDTEEEKTLCRMASLRLCLPVSLSDGDRQVYQSYLLAHMESFCDEMIRQRDLSIILELKKPLLI